MSNQDLGNRWHGPVPGAVGASSDAIPQVDGRGEAMQVMAMACSVGWLCGSRLHASEPCKPLAWSIEPNATSSRRGRNEDRARISEKLGRVAGIGFLRVNQMIVTRQTEMRAPVSSQHRPSALCTKYRCTHVGNERHQCRDSAQFHHYEVHNPKAALAGVTFA
jgi:hypothetical protein